MKYLEYLKYLEWGINPVQKLLQSRRDASSGITTGFNLWMKMGRSKEVLEVLEVFEVLKVGPVAGGRTT